MLPWGRELPLAHVSGGLYLALYVVRQRREEVEARDALHLVNRVVVEVTLTGTVVVAHYNAKSLGSAGHTEHHLEESPRHHDLVGTDGEVTPTTPHWAANDVDVAVLSGPSATVHLQAIP